MGPIACGLAEVAEGGFTLFPMWECSYPKWEGADLAVPSSNTGAL